MTTASPPRPSSARPSSGAAADALLAEAIRHHLSGDLAAAERHYQEVLESAPFTPGALNNLGAILAQRGDLARALDCFERSVAAAPQDPEAQHNLGLALSGLRRPEAAITALREALRLDAGRWSWWVDLGNALLECQWCDQALDAYDHALALAPTEPTVHANRGIALRGLRRLDDAIAATERALSLQPDSVDALSNLGVMYKELRRFDDAHAAFDHALRVAPHHPAVQVNLAVLLMELNRHDEAAVFAERLLAQRPDEPEALNVLGNCAMERGALADAEAYHQRALALDPANRNANWNVAVLTLLRGDLAEGFRLFEHRKRLVSVVFSRRDFPVPEWDGSPLDGRTVFVHAEQGLGDVIQFVRYAAALHARGAARVIVESPPSLAELLRGVPGVDAVVSPGDVVPPFDVHAYLMSLPYLCGTTADTVPAPPAYLTAPARPVTARVQRATAARARVGIVWAGNPAHQRDLIRSVPLAALAPLFAQSDVAFFSLQKGAPATQLTDPAFAGITNLDGALGDFGDTAAAIAALDVVITVDTSVAHLAGALGVETWVLLPFVPDWRWQMERDTTAWYPSMRLFRQGPEREWAAPVARVAAALAAYRREGRPETPEHVRAGARATSPAAAVTTTHTGPRSKVPTIEVTWPIGVQSGWGTYGLHLALGLQRSSRADVILGAPPSLDGVSPLHQRAVTRVPRGDAPRGAIRLVALGNGFRGDPAVASRGTEGAVGVVFFEDTHLDAAAVARAGAFDRIIAGSTWNAEMLKASGLDRVHLVLQGVDPAVFHPGPGTRAIRDRFLIFSGGKLEFRKGQDIVVEAFRRFHARHPDAVLVTAWHNHWPATMAGIDASGYVAGLPPVHGGRCEIGPWLRANGLPADAVIDLGLQTQVAMGDVLRSVDVAVCPNRCEGGTNLVAMEAMACGVPTILSANTGHLNLIGDDTCVPLERQGMIAKAPALYAGTLCWGESDPDEIVAALERLYTDREAAARIGARGAALLAQLPWDRQVDALIDAVLAPHGSSTTVSVGATDTQG